MTRKQAELLESLEARGFDASRVSGRRGVSVGCTQCAALVVCGVATHEHGCPNGRRFACWQCGQEYRDREDAAACCAPVEFDEPAEFFDESDRLDDGRWGE